MNKKFRLYTWYLLILIGMVLGAILGDIILKASTEIRMDDILGCRLGIPIFGGIVFGLSGLSIIK